MIVKKVRYNDGNMVLIGVNEIGEEFYAASAEVTLEYHNENEKRLEERMVREALRVIEDITKEKALNEENSIYKNCWHWERRGYLIK